MTNHRAMHILFWAFTLLVIGIGIYFFFRPPIIALAKLHIAQYEYTICNTRNPFIYFFVYCLPDALWYMSLLLVQTLFFERKGWLNRILIGTAISLPFLLETGQYLGFISGTFDGYDILTYSLTLILFLCLRKTSLLQQSK